MKKHWMLIVVLIGNAGLFSAAAYRISIDGWPSHIPWLFLECVTVNNLIFYLSARRQRREIQESSKP